MAGRPKNRKNKSLSKERAFQKSIDTNLRAIKIITGLALNGQIPQEKLQEINHLLQSMNEVLQSKATKKEIQVIKALRENKEDVYQHILEQ